MERRPPDLDKILAQRAERLGIPIDKVRDSAPPEPQFLQGAMEKNAAASIDDVLREDSQHFEQSTYPSPDCLEPHEVDLCLSGQLDSGRMQHLESCTACRALIAACQPSDDRVHRFMEEVRQLSISALQGRQKAAGLLSFLERLER